jgi:protein-L-isoaspartate(D-aspartate) O-methyltransferase
MLDLAYARDRMIDVHLVRRGLSDERVLRAMRRVPREAFVDPGYEEFAYEDSPLSIGEGQTISQPYIVALMIEKAEIDPGDTVLEVGTGSGYAAAVMSRIAEQVYTIERHASLGEAARRRFKRLGFENVAVRIGDGTRGWPDMAPFDAIVVAAGGPTVPTALKDQLEIGGRLVIPIGSEGEQRLIRITRANQNSFDEEDLGGVRFVPLIGEQGWSGERFGSSEPLPRAPTLPERIAQVAEPLPEFEDAAFGELFDRFGRRRVVPLGEASHGTSEFYKARAVITRRLVEQHGFNIVAVEADWPDASAIDRYVRGRPGKGEETPFQRFPTWMWRNREMAEFIGWMRRHNDAIAVSEMRAGFYGLDIYNMSASIAAVLRHLDSTDPQAAKIARERYGCLTSWQNEPSTYGRAVLTEGYGKCEQGVIAQCREMLERRFTEDKDDFLDAAQNARLVASAERYYRTMYYGGAESWNLRDTHMFETLEQVLEARGPDSKAVVWAHNSHVGDARHTDMASNRGEVSIGQLCRERFGEEAVLIGFGTHEGEVAAATDWDREMEVKTIRPSLRDSYEELFHRSGRERFLLDFGRDEALRIALREPRLERFIGVIYRPETERLSHYMYASLAQQFDAFVWFDRTAPVAPLGSESHDKEVPETYPFGL